jgi:hypothetical protein
MQGSGAVQFTLQLRYARDFSLRSGLSEMMPNRGLKAQTRICTAVAPMYLPLDEQTSIL